MQFRQQSDMALKRGWFFPVLVLAALASGPATPADPSRITITPATLGNWQETSFSGQTQYQAEDGGQGQALHATAQGSASGLCQPVQVDLRDMPILGWSWRLDRAPPERDERAPEGDDQGLRVGFVHRAGPDEDSILSVQFVWSQAEAAGHGWPNPFVPSAYQIAVRSGPAEPGAWHTEQRDLAADFRAAAGRQIDKVDAVCLMTDGDQTGALVEAWYGDITFEPR